MGPKESYSCNNCQYREIKSSFNTQNNTKKKNGKEKKKKVSIKIRLRGPGMLT